MFERANGVPVPPVSGVGNPIVSKVSFIEYTWAVSIRDDRPIDWQPYYIVSKVSFIEYTWAISIRDDRPIDWQPYSQQSLIY
jgi:hypothetical protein